MNKEELKDKFYLMLRESSHYYDEPTADGCAEIAESYAQSQTESLKKEIEELRKDSKMIDFLQTIMTNDDNYCEVYLAGLRDFTGKANAFQIETNPEKIPTINKPSLREAIQEAMNVTT